MLLKLDPVKDRDLAEFLFRELELSPLELDALLRRSWVRHSEMSRVVHVRSCPERPLYFYRARASWLELLLSDRSLAPCCAGKGPPALARGYDALAALSLRAAVLSPLALARVVARRAHDWRTRVVLSDLTRARTQLHEVVAHFRAQAEPIDSLVSATHAQLREAGLALVSRRDAPRRVDTPGYEPLLLPALVELARGGPTTLALIACLEHGGSYFGPLPPLRLLSPELTRQGNIALVRAGTALAALVEEHTSALIQLPLELELDPLDSRSLATAQLAIEILAGSEEFGFLDFSRSDPLERARALEMVRTAFASAAAACC